MQNFYAPRNSFTKTTISLAGQEYLHAACSCRVRKGERIGVTDGCGKRVVARIETIDSHSITTLIEEDVSGVGEPDTVITVALSVIKLDRFETALEKCTELGVRRFIPLIAERCELNFVSRLKQERLEKIILEAAKQSGRSWVPGIAPAVTLMEFAQKTAGSVYLAYQKADKDLENVLGQNPADLPVTLVIGPEGDFTDEEYTAMISAGAVPFSLGGLILRSETAAITAAALIVHLQNR